jgi:uncharacterized protein (DUF2062 family)
MPRKYFRKFLPSHEQVRKNRYIAYFGKRLQHHNLWHLHRRSVAGGMAVGMFCGLVPGPVQMLAAALLSILFRVNLPVAMMATWYTNPLTIVPLYYIAYKLGTFITGMNVGAIPGAPLGLRVDNIADWIPMLMDWIAAMGKPFFLGLVLLALILAVAGYVAVLVAWRVYITLAWRARQRRRRESLRS